MDDAAAHLQWAPTAFSDRGYMRVGGKPACMVSDQHDRASNDGFIAHWHEPADWAALRGVCFVAIFSIRSLRSSPAMNRRNRAF